MKKQKLFLPTLADLIDALSINQIKEVLLADRQNYSDEMKKIAHDIDLIVKEKTLRLNARLIRIIVILAQMNLHIWINKDKMKEQPDKYLQYLKLAHQLNGIRNRMKNLILEVSQTQGVSKRRTNTETDDLEGWDISLK